MIRTKKHTSRWLDTARCWAMVLLLAVVGVSSAYANEEEDFVSHYMQLYNEDSTLQCVTLSPQMMLAAAEAAAEVAEAEVLKLLSHIHSMRIVTLNEDGMPEDTGKADTLHSKALELIHRNPKRYQAYYDDPENTGVSIWMRKKKEVILEIVLVANTPDEEFTIVDITGEMNDELVANLIGIGL